MLACSSDEGAGPMAVVRSRGRFGVTLGLALAVVACGGSGGGSSDSDPNAGESDDALIPASCTEADARRFETLLVGDTKCENVRGERGTWLGRRLFTDAPEGFRDRACRFTWRATNGSSPDREALEVATQGAELTPTCARGTPPTLHADEVEAANPGEILPQGGSIGCDVCGILDRRKVWIVRPPNVDRIRFSANLADAQTGRIVDYKSFAVEPPRGPSLVVQLPEPPAGQQWVDGPINLRR
jgi:hypothetical protein